MTFVGRSLADGTLPAAAAPLYTVPASTRAVIKSIDIVSATPIVQTVELYVTRSGSTIRRIVRVESLQLNETIHWGDEGEPLSLSTGDVISGVATSAGSLDYTITGAEETP